MSRPRPATRAIAVAERVHERQRAREERWDSRRDARVSGGAAKAMRESDKRVNQQVLGAVLLALGGNWLLQEFGVFKFGWPGLFAIALMTLGMSMAFTAKSGRTKPLIALGIVLTLGLAMSSGVSNPVRGQSIGDRTYAPLSANQVRENYTLGVGQLTIDLRHVDFPPGQHNVNAELTVGELMVIVPEGLKVDVTAEVDGVGDVNIFDEVSDEGPGARGKHQDTDYANAEVRLDLDLDLRGVGDITVVHE